jgi:hypothetical protein
VFDFDAICQRLADKLVRRHPHVFGDVAVRDVDQVWVNWEKIKRAEKQGTRHERRSALDGIPARMPALMRAQKLVKKARKAHLMESPSKRRPAATQSALARQLFELAEQCHDRGWSAEELLRSEIRRRERHWRRQEQKTQPRPSVTPEPPGPQTRQASAGSHRK